MDERRKGEGRTRRGESCSLAKTEVASEFPRRSPSVSSLPLTSSDAWRASSSSSHRPRPPPPQPNTHAMSPIAVPSRASAGDIKVRP